MSAYLQIVWEGYDGSVWHVSGKLDDTEGVLLKREGITGHMDPPMETKWVKGPFGKKFQGAWPDRRDMVMRFQIHGGGDPTVWRDRESRFRLSWDYWEEGKLRFITFDENGDEVDNRYVSLRLLQEPKAEEPNDPHCTADTEIIITAAAENPYYVDETFQQDYVIETSTGSVTDFFVMMNDGDVDVWPHWVLSSVPGGVVYTLPDPSHGSEEYLSGVADAARTVPVPALLAGEHVDIMSDPDEEYIISDLDTNPWARTDGLELRYPIPRRTEATFVPVSWVGATVGDSIRFKYVRLFSRPWAMRYSL